VNKNLITTVATRKPQGNTGFVSTILAELICLLILIAPFASAKADSVAPNIIRNGTFQNGKSPWWGTAGVVGDFSNDGQSALKLTQGFVCQDKLPIEGGKRYRVNMKIRAEAASDSSIFVQISYRGAGVDPGWRGPESVPLPGGTEPALFVTGGTHDWRLFSAIVEAPPNANEFLIYLRKSDNTPGDALYSEVAATITADAVTTAADQKKSELAKLLAPRQLRAATNLNVSATPQTITLAQHGRSEYKIYVGPEPDVITLGAAAELADYLQRISGTNFLPLLPEPKSAGDPLVVVGRDNPLAQKLAPDIPYDTLGDDGFVIRYVGRHVVVAGATPRGTMYGVNWLLDRKLGVKWLSPDYTYVPNMPTVIVKASNEIQIPRFHYREVLSAEGQDKTFRAHNLLNGESHGPSFSPSPPEIDSWSHEWSAKGGEANFLELLPTSIYGKDHPDWYAGGQLAMMNKDLRREMSNVLIARLRALPDYRKIWFEVHDMDWEWDMDRESRAFADAHGKQPSAPRLDMMIDVANRVRSVLPDAKLAFNAYHWSFTPPDGMRVPDYLLVVPMTIHVDYSSALNKGRNEKLGRDIATWNAISDHIFIWDHITNFSGFIQPTPNIYPITESIKWLATLNDVEGYFAEGSFNTPGAEFSSLRAWLIARLLWNPNDDARQLVSQYCEYYFGHAAAPFVLRYIDLMHAAIAKSGDILREKTQVDMRMFDLDFIRAADELFANATVAASPSAVFSKHVLEARMPIDYVIVARRSEYHRAASLSGATWDDSIAERYARLMRTAQAAGLTQYRQNGTIEELSRWLAIERREPKSSELVSHVAKSDWFELQDLSFNQYGSSGIVADPVASDGASARILGSDPTWAVQIKLDKLPKTGCWDMYVDIRADGDQSRANDNAMLVGSYPPFGNFVGVKLGDLNDDRYHSVKVPGGPFSYTENYERGIYIQPAPGAATKFIYVDRTTGVRTTCPLR
jgi:hypothetical protein